MLPIPDDNDARMEPQVRLFEFLEGHHWIEVFNLMGGVRQAGEQDNNPLYSACQAVMAEVGYQHTARAEIIDALEPDSTSQADILSAIKDLRGRETSEGEVTQATPRPAGLPPTRDVELAIQRVLARVDVVPKELPVATFLDLCKQIADEL